MKLLKNKTIATLICFIMIILGLFAGSLRCINNEKAKARRYFSSASKSNPVPLTKDLEIKCGYAANLVTLYKKYSGDSKADALENSVKALKSSMNSPKKAYKYSAEISVDAVALRNAIDGLALSDNDRGAYTRLKQELLSIDDIIARNGYNTVAGEANKRINTLPIRFFKTIMLIGDVEYFK